MRGIGRADHGDVRHLPDADLLPGEQAAASGGGRADQEPDLHAGARLPVDPFENHAPAFGAVWKLWLVAIVV